MPVLKPTGAPVPKPEGGNLAEAGEPVAMSLYWHRRLLDKSVVLVKVEAPAAPETSLATPKPAARRRTKKE